MSKQETREPTSMLRLPSPTTRDAFPRKKLRDWSKRPRSTKIRTRR